MAQVAVVVAAYNPGPYLSPALDSIRAQSFRDWECVVVDDGSAEDLSWVDHVDRRIRLVRQVNAGCASARNRGATETSAPIVAYLDHDDLWLPGYLEAQLEYFNDADVALVSAAFESIDGRGVVTGPGFCEWRGSYEEMLQGCGIVPTSAMVRRDALDRVGGFRSVVSEDWDLWLRIGRDGGGVAQNPAVLVQYRRHDSNVSNDFRRMYGGARRILREHRHPVARVGLRNVRMATARQAFDLARESEQPFSSRLSALIWAARRDPAYVLPTAARWLVGHVGIKGAA